MSIFICFHVLKMHHDSRAFFIKLFGGLTPIRMIKGGSLIFQGLDRDICVGPQTLSQVYGLQNFLR